MMMMVKRRRRYSVNIQVKFRTWFQSKSLKGKEHLADLGVDGSFSRAPYLSAPSDYGIELSLVSLTTERLLAESAGTFS
jgi:hypothetical protein